MLPSFFHTQHLTITRESYGLRGSRTVLRGGGEVRLLCSTHQLHFIFNTYGKIVRMQITGGNIDDCSPVMNLVKDISAKLIGDKDTVLSFNNFFHFFCIKSINLYSFYIFIKSRFVLKHAINNMQQLTHCSN